MKDNATAAAVALLSRALEIAGQAYEADPDASIPVGHKWVQTSRTDDSAVYSLQESSLDARALAVGTAVGELKESHEAKALAQALVEDETIGPFLGKMVFSGGMGVTLSAEAIADNLIQSALSQNDWEAVPDAAAEIWAEFIKACVPGKELLSLVAPLQNFVGPPEPLSLGDDLVIDQMTDDEVSRAIQMGVLTSPFPAVSQQAVTSLWAVRITYGEEVFLALPNEPPSLEAAGKSQERLVAAVDGVVHALLLFKNGFVAAESATIIPRDAYPLGGGWVARWSLGTKAGRHGPRYELATDESDDFLRFCAALAKSRANHPPLDTAVRRFGDAAGRSRADDQLTDLIIALEALLLTDSERGEKRFQVALRVAAFLEMGGTTRRDVLGFMKRAYDVRSSIVHGGSPSPSRLKNIAGEETDLQAFADEAIEVVRRVLKQVTEAVEETGEFAVDWEVQLLGEQ